MAVRGDCFVSMDVKRNHFGDLSRQVHETEVLVRVRISTSVKIPNVEDRSAVITAANVKFLHSIVCTAASFFHLRLLFPDSQNSELASLIYEKVYHCIWRTQFVNNKAGLFYRRYTVLNVLIVPPKLPINVLNTLVHPDFFEGPLQTMFDLLISEFPGQELL